jgi:hypothetical protein
MNTNYVTHQIKLSSWAQKIRDQQASGISVRAWCTLNNISRDQFFYWKCRIKDACIESQLPDIVPISLPTTDGGSKFCTTFPPCAPDSHCGDDYATVPKVPSIKLNVNDVIINVTSDIPDDLIAKAVRAVKHA